MAHVCEQPGDSAQLELPQETTNLGRRVCLALDPKEQPLAIELREKQAQIRGHPNHPMTYDRAS